MMKKTLWRIGMITMLVVIALAVFVSAETYTEEFGTGLTWSLDTETEVLTISGEGAMPTYTSWTQTPWYSYIDDISEVVVEEGITRLSDNLFPPTPILKGIRIPSTVTKISVYALCEVEEIIVASENVKFQVIDGVLFENKTVTNDDGSKTYVPFNLVKYPSGSGRNTYIVPDGTTKIESYSFYSVDDVAKVVFPDSVTTLGANAFTTCGLKEVRLSSGMTSIGHSAFYKCAALESVDIPEGIVEINHSAFDNCTSLKEIILPDSVATIGYDVFRNNRLQRIRLSAGLKTLNKNAFNYCELEEVQFAAGLNALDLTIFQGMSTIEAITVEEGSTAFSSVDGVLFNGDGTEMLLFPRGKVATEYTVPNGVKTIGEKAFATHEALNTIWLPSSVESIGANAFANCTYLRDLYFYGNTPTVDAATFAEANTLTIHYAAGTTGWTNPWNGFETQMWEPEPEPVTYTVSYELCGGTGGFAQQVKKHGEDLSLTFGSPYRAGYSFLGWGTAQDAQTAVYQPGGLYIKDESVTLYALWKANTYTISFDANNGENAPAEIMKTHDVEIALPAETPVRMYYEFLGWSTSASASAALYSAGGVYTENASATLYAVWKPVTYAVTYDANGGTDAPAAQIKTAGADLVLSAQQPVRVGYEFLGWSADLTVGAQYQPQDIYSADADITLYAVWQQVVTGDEGVVTLSSTTVAPGGTVTLTASIANNQGLAGFLFEIVADTTVFSVPVVEDELSIAAGEVCKSGTLLTNTSENGWKVMWYCTKDVATNGTLFTVELQVAEDAPEGTYSFKMVCSDEDTVKTDGTMVPLVMQESTVTVSAGVKGDVSGDGRVTNSDVITLARAMIGLTELTEQQMTLADVSGDGKVSNTDVIKLARAVIGLETIN